MVLTVGAGLGKLVKGEQGKMVLATRKVPQKKEATDTEETENDSSDTSQDSDESSESEASTSSSDSSSEAEDDTSPRKPVASNVIKKTVIRSTDVPPNAPAARPPTQSSAQAQQLLRSIQGSSLFKTNKPFSSLSQESSSSPPIQTLHLSNPLKPLLSMSTTSSSALISDLMKTRKPTSADSSGLTNNTSSLEQNQLVSSSVLRADVPAGATPRSGRRRRRRAITICLSHCRYDIVRKTSERFGLVEVSEDQPWNIYWTDYSVSLERAVEMRRFQIVNHFPGMNEICRKDLLARNLNRMRRNFPTEYDIFPMSWCLPADGNELATYSSTRRGRTYICKPEMGCQGRGIFLVKNVKDLNPFGRIICQVYIQKPFLIDFLKFDLRIYVLITSCDPLRIWVYKEGMARFATAKYRQPSSNNTENSYMHLTNYAVNKFSRDYIMDNEESGSKRKLSTVYQWLRDRDYMVDKLKSEVDDVIIKTILSAQPILKHHYRTCFPHHDICSACFELLGFDVLLDHKLKPYVIEVNHSPSFHMDTNLDRELKEELLRDTFSMLNIKQLERRKIENEDRRRVQRRLANRVAEMNKNRMGTAHGANNNGSNSSANNNKGAGDGFRSADKNSKKHSNETTPREGGKENGEKSGKIKLVPEDAQFKHEIDNCGGYRLIYPLPDAEKYDKFLDQNICSIYQETAASQARAHMTRTQLDEYNQKKRSDEKKRPAPHIPKEEKLRPESPNKTTNRKAPTSAVSKDGATTTTTTGTTSKPLVHSSFSSASLDFGIGNRTPAGLPIVTREEYERAKTLMQRGMLIRSLGIELQVYNLLSQVGSLKPSEHEDFRRKHGFAVSQTGIYNQRVSTASVQAPNANNYRTLQTALQYPHQAVYAKKIF